MKSFKFIIFALLLITPILSNSQETKTRIDVLYFHATLRCQGCLTIEEFVKNTILTKFSKNLEDSTLTMSSIDFQQPENEHFQDDYQFDVQTLIISKKIDGKEIKWKNLDKIWDYSDDFKKFQKYIEDEINKFYKES